MIFLLLVLTCVMTQQRHGAFLLACQPTIAVTQTPTAVPTASPTPVPTQTATQTATQTPTSTATPIPTASPTPSPGPTPTPAPGSYFHIVSGYNGTSAATGACLTADGGSCTNASPCCTASKFKALLSSASAGSNFWFNAADTWNEQVDWPTGVKGANGNVITVGKYGAGSGPIFDGQNCAIDHGFDLYGAGNSNSTNLYAYITIQDLTFKGYASRAIRIYQTNPSNTGGMPGMIVQRVTVTKNGPGSCNGGAQTDPGPYWNTGQLVMADAGKNADSFRFLNNTVTTVGGHNAFRIEGDTGANTAYIGNTASGCYHNCFDFKGVATILVDSNIAHDWSIGAGIYTEDTGYPVATQNATITRNQIYNPPSNFSDVQCENTTSGDTTNCFIYNNTLLTNGVSGTQAIFRCANPTSGVNLDNLNVRNNILDSPNALQQGSGGCAGGTTTTYDYNDDCATYGSCNINILGTTYTTLATLQAAGFGTHDLFEANPKYNNANSDLTLKAGSPCIGAGLANLVDSLTNMGFQ